MVAFGAGDDQLGDGFLQLRPQVQRGGSDRCWVRQGGEMITCARLCPPLSWFLLHGPAGGDVVELPQGGRVSAA